MSCGCWECKERYRRSVERFVAQYEEVTYSQDEFSVDYGPAEAQRRLFNMPMTTMRRRIPPQKVGRSTDFPNDAVDAERQRMLDKAAYMLAEEASHPVQTMDSLERYMKITNPRLTQADAVSMARIIEIQRKNEEARKHGWDGSRLRAPFGAG